MIGRADIEGSKSNVALNAWLPQASYPCGNFSDTSSLRPINSTEGSIGHAFTVRIVTANQNQMSLCPFALQEVSVLSELILGHPRYCLTDVPPQPNSPNDNVLGAGWGKQRQRWYEAERLGKTRGASERREKDNFKNRKDFKKVFQQKKLSVPFYPNFPRPTSWKSPLPKLVTAS